jgi:hypothetical protein
MKHLLRMIGLPVALAASSTLALVFAQEKTPAPAPPPDKEFRLQTGPEFQAPDFVLGGGVGFSFVSSEFSLDKLVKGAPYSAEAVTEMTQTLSDGNRIVNSTTTVVYRDSEGRTRREQTIRAIGPFSTSGEGLTTISINDPAKGTAYMLDPANRIAFKNQVFQFEMPPPPEAAGGPGVRVRGQVQNFTFARNGGGEMQVVTAEPGVRAGNEPPKPKIESLGKQSVEGVDAIGTRTTITIAAGQIGNERPIEIVDEHWYSQELQTTVMSRHSDPRSGEVVYRLKNINRAEPDHSLFEVPANYTIKSGPEPPPFQLRTGKPGRPEELLN